MVSSLPRHVAGLLIPKILFKQYYRLVVHLYVRTPGILMRFFPFKPTSFRCLSNLRMGLHFSHLYDNQLQLEHRSDLK